MVDTINDLPVVKQGAPQEPDMTPLRITIHPDPNKAGSPGGVPSKDFVPGTVDQLPVVMPAPMAGKEADTAATNSRFSDVLNAFGQGYAHEWGAPNFAKDLSAEFKKYDLSNDWNPGKAFNEAFVRPALDALDVGLRGIKGTGAAIHDASVAAGPPFSAVAAGMEAFPLFGVELGRLGWLPGTVKKPVTLGEAKDLGVIGEEPKPPLPDGAPAKVAAEGVPATSQVDAYGVPATVHPNNVTQPGEYPWFEKAQAYINKLDAPDSVISLLQDALKTSDFTQARAGNVPVAQWGPLSEASGIPSKFFKDAKGPASDLMKHDDAVRAATAMMLKAADDVVQAAQAVKLKGGVEDAAELAALGEAMMRRKLIVDTAMEQVMGLRAEFGRTGNALQEFLKAKTGTENLSGLLKDQAGHDADALRKIADGLDKLPSRTQQTRFLRDASKPDFMDKLLWYWTNALLSGPITHAKYVIANSAYVAFDALIATPAAGVSGAVRQGLSDEQINRVYMGEAVAKVYGLVAGVPDALIAAKQAVRTGLPTPLPVQLKGAGNKNPVTGLKPIGGPVGTVIGAPSNVIAGIHSFYNFLGFRAEIEAQGYRQAVKDGYKPTTTDFWKAQRDHAAFPDDPMMDAGILAGQRANFVQDLGPMGQATQGFLYKTKIGRFVIPFLKVPGNIVNFAQEGSPLAYLDARMRADLTGKNGGPARDMANGRLAGGSAIMGWAAYKSLADEITGSGPADPKQRAEWLRTHQPNSVKIGGYWVSADRFGPVGMWLTAAANLTDAARDVNAWKDMPGVSENDKKRADAQLQEAYARVVTGATNTIKEAGFQGLFDYVEALNDPNKSKMSNFGRGVGTFMPFSSGQSQIASFIDPNMRETNTFIDGIRNMIPVQRETLPAAVDWLGDRRPNPGYHAIIKNVPVNFDPINLEMQHLDLKPTVPENNIRGARMTQEQYDEFKVYAGVNTRHQLEHWMNQPNWPLMPDYAKKAAIEASIKAARKQAEATMFGRYPALIGQGVQEKYDDKMGTRTKPDTYQRP